MINKIICFANLVFVFIVFVLLEIFERRQAQQCPSLPLPRKQKDGNQGKRVGGGGGGGEREGRGGGGNYHR